MWTFGADLDSVWSCSCYPDPWRASYQKCLCLLLWLTILYEDTSGVNRNV
jgi:hypothetical protein